MKSLAIKLIKHKNLTALFFVILFVGLLLRLYFIFSKDVFTDEVFYSNVSWTSSIIDLIKINHWIKDHPQLYLLCLKFLGLFTKNIVFLRLSNIFLYLIISFLLFNFFINLGFGLVALLPVVLFSFNSYFVYLNVYLSPFNLVLFFFSLSFFLLSNFILNFRYKSELNLFLFAFPLLSSLAFYSDYSIIYFYFLFVPVLSLLFIWNKKKALIFLLSLCINLFLIFPGLIQLRNNFNNFYELNTHTYFDKPFLKISVFSDILLFKMGGNISLLFFLAIILLLLIILLITKKRSIEYLLYASLIGLLEGTVFLFLFSNIFFSIFAERTFWFFYFNLIIAFTAIGCFLYKYSKKLSVLFVLFIVSVLIVRFSQKAYFFFPGNLPTPNLDYKNLINRILQSPKSEEMGRIVFLDKKALYYPLKEYYFLGRHLSKQSDEYKKLEKMTQAKELIRIKSLEEIDDLNFSKKEVIFLIVFNLKDDEYKKLTSKIEKYQGSQLNLFLSRLNCQKNNCVFEYKKL